jgi:FO synthase
MEDHLWTIAVARVVLGPQMAIQAPPNLSKGNLVRLVEAGINDWGGVSPVTPDHVNPEAPWPHLAVLERATHAAGKHLVQRLPVYPSYLKDADRWLDGPMVAKALSLVDSEGFVRPDAWSPGAQMPIPRTGSLPAMPNSGRALMRLLDKAALRELDENEIVTLFAARGRDFEAVCRAADEMRASTCGDTVTYVVTRNINYTNVCTYKCQFCAFSKGRGSENLRGTPYDLSIEEVQRRVREAWARGASEVCLQGGIHPAYTGATYLEICRAVKAAAPGIHVHAFSPLEIRQGAATLGLSVADFLAALKEAGLGTLPGTAAEILDDEVRSVLCPDKLNTQEWLEVMATAHGLGLRSTSTIMFGHMEHPVHWARHLLRLRRLQERTGGFTEFVPLPFVHMQAPVYLKGRARRGPTFREAILMHAVGRLVLNGFIDNVQTSWVKMGPDGAAAALAAGANDLGGTLMNETISRAAGASHGQEMSPEIMEHLILGAGRKPMQRTTLYRAAPTERRAASFSAAPLCDVINTPVRPRKRSLATC